MQRGCGAPVQGWVSHRPRVSLEQPATAGLHTPWQILGSRLPGVAGPPWVTGRTRRLPRWCQEQLREQAHLYGSPDRQKNLSPGAENPASKLLECPAPRSKVRNWSSPGSHAVSTSALTSPLEARKLAAEHGVQAAHLEAPSTTISGQGRHPEAAPCPHTLPEQNPELSWVPCPVFPPLSGRAGPQKPLGHKKSVSLTMPGPGASMAARPR